MTTRNSSKHKVQIESSIGTDRNKSPDNKGDSGSTAHISDSVLRDELMAEGIHVPWSIFDLSISTDGDISPAEDTVAAREAIAALQTKQIYDAKLMSATMLHIDMLRKQNAALAAGISTLLKPERAAIYREVLHKSLRQGNAARPYRSAENPGYAHLIETSIQSTSTNFAETLFSELAEFEVFILLTLLDDSIKYHVYMKWCVVFLCRCV